MAKFSYTITDKQGRSEKGFIEAISREEAASQVKKDNWFIVFLEKEKESKFNLPLFGDKDKFSSFERIVFTDHLVAMFNSGTPLIDALETYCDDESKRGAAIIERMIKEIERGRKLSEAMSSFPKTFSPLYLALVQSGELTGRLDEVLEYMAKELRREYEFSERIKSALLYPALVLIVAFFVVLLLVLVVIPKITVVTKSFGGNLPLVTRIVSSVASALTAFGPLIILLVLVAVVAIFFILRIKKTKEKLDPYLLRLPLVGPLLKKYILARFLRLVGSCVKYGIPLSSSLAIVREVVGNLQYKEACERTNAKVVKGVSLSKALSQEESDLFPRSIIRTLRGAEKTGYVDEAMLRLSNFYEDGIDRELKRITDLIEPFLVIVLGIIVAAIAISVIAPIYQMTARIK